jgi:prepilin-type processing-associated H-X9-DG protein
MRYPPRARRPGFSLFELLVIIAVIAILLGLLLPAIQKVREAADRMTCTNNLHQIALAAHNHHGTYGFLPPAIPASDSKAQLSFFFCLLPFIEQENLYKIAGPDENGVWSVWRSGVFDTPLKVYSCPVDASGGTNQLYRGWLATGSYAANFMAFGTGGVKITDFTDGTSNTLIITERYQICDETPCAWAYTGATDWAPIFAYSSFEKFQLNPPQSQCNPALAQSAHSSTINLGFADGSVRTGTTKVSSQTWYYMCTPAGGEVIDFDF